MTPELAALVEKVARAMQAKSDLYPILGWDDVGELTREMWRGDALAAIRCIAEATREPTEEMENAGEKRDYRYGNTDCMTHWRAMHAASVLGEALRHGE